MDTRHRIYPPLLERAREMRHPQTPAEATLWRVLRNRNLEYKFRRQHPIDRFIIDFYCAKAKLCIEIDGASHLEPEQAEYDLVRSEFLEELGYQVIRFTNDDVRYNINVVVDEITRTVERALNPPLPSKGEGRGEGQAKS
jgi:very-short-patch-repair endonuclease